MKVAWVFDVISPFSYLSLKRLSQLPANVDLDFVPVLFAGILNHHGQVGNAEIKEKRRFTYRFVLWRARRLGIPMRMPPAHPFNPLAALRLILAAGNTRAAIETVFDAVYLHGHDVADARVITALAGELGISETAINGAQVKQKLRENTDWAVSKGLFGVPSFVAGDDIFWGDDSFEMLLDYLKDPGLFRDPEMLRIDGLPVGASRRA